MRCPGESSQHDADHGEADEGSGGGGVAFEVAREASVPADPGQGSFDDPSFGQDDELVHLAAFDDLDGPAAGARHDRRHLRSLVAGIGEDALDERKQRPRPRQHPMRAIPVLNVGRMDEDAQQEAERVDQDVTLAPEDFLARVIPLRIERSPPFEAPLAL